MSEEIAVEDLVRDVDSSYNRLIGGFLELSEGFFRDNTTDERWKSFRKLVLDLGNNSRRLIVDKLEGRSFKKFNYTLVKRKGC